MSALVRFKSSCRWVFSAVFWLLVAFPNAQAEGKIRLEDFQDELLPGEPWTLKAGTELNVVLDYHCLEIQAETSRLSTFATGLYLDWDSLRAEMGLGERSHHWVLPHPVLFSELERHVNEDECVAMVVPDGDVHLFAFSRDPFVNVQSHLKFLGAERARDVLVDSAAAQKPVVIAIVDSGVDLSHEDLRPNAWFNIGERANGRDDDGNGYRDDVNGYNFASHHGDPGPEGTWPNNRHGTHVAGLAAARVDNRIGGAGVHGRAQIMAVNVFGRSPFAKMSTVENGIRYAAANGADVINLSLGGREYSRSMKHVLERAIAAGSFVVAAAGNVALEISSESQNLGYLSPASYGGEFQGMVTVASVDVNGGSLSPFSNYNNQIVEIAAPGSDSSWGLAYGGLFSCELTSKYGLMSGTSMAAPLVSGAVAIVKSWLLLHGYSASPADIERVLIESSPRDPRLRTYVKDGAVLNLEALAGFLKARFP